MKALVNHAPNGWRLAALGELCNINPARPRDFKRDPDTPTTFVPMEAVDEVTGTITGAVFRPYQEVARGYTYFAEGDIIFAKITPCMQNGKTAIATSLADCVGFGSTEFHVLRPNPGVCGLWIYLLLRTAEFRKLAEENFEGSAGQRRVPDLFLREVRVPIVDDPQDQERLAAELQRELERVYAMRRATERQLEAISAFPAAMLREFFSFGGQVNG